MNDPDELFVGDLLAAGILHFLYSRLASTWNIPTPSASADDSNISPVWKQAFDAWRVG